MNTSIQTRSRSSSLGPNLDVVTTVAEPLMVNQLATEAAEEPGECNKTDISPSPPKSAVQVSIESLMTSLKDEFGDKIKDKRMAKSMAKLSKDSETLVQNFEQVIEKELTTEVTEELDSIREAVNKTGKLDETVSSIMQMSALSVQKIGHMRELHNGAGRNNTNAASLIAQLSQSESVRDLISKNKAAVSSLSEDARSLLSSYSRLMK